MLVLRLLEYVLVRTARDPDLSDSQFLRQAGLSRSWSPRQWLPLRRPNAMPWATPTIGRRLLPREPAPASRRSRKASGRAPGGKVLPKDLQTGQGPPPYTLLLAVVAPADGSWRARPRS